MTNEEVINKLKHIRRTYPSKDIENIEADNALSIAIKALEQQDTLTCYCPNCGARMESEVQE